MNNEGPYRGVMSHCYHRDCDSVRTQKKTQFASYDFLSMTSQTVIDSIINLSNAQCSASTRAEKLRSEENVTEDLETIDDNSVDNTSGSSSSICSFISLPVIFMISYFTY